MLHALFGLALGAAGVLAVALAWGAIYRWRFGTWSD